MTVIKEIQQKGNTDTSLGRSMPSAMAAEASGSSPINNTWLRRVLILIAIKFLRYRAPRRGCVLFLSRKMCVKYGGLQDFSEAATMQFVRQHTSIPVPKVYCTFSHRNQVYIVMQRIDGDTVNRGWYSRTEESKAKIFSQLKEFIAELRNLPHPADGPKIANVDGGSLYDCRLPGTSNRYGPFASVAHFHHYLHNGIEEKPGDTSEISQLIAQHRGSWPVCFTHADLSSFNILVRGDEVVGIVDWETAGWLPSYWEYTTAWNVNPHNKFWQNEVGNFIEPMPKELAMEGLRRKYFGDF